METTSLCPKCYKEIPAEIHQGEHVWMTKTCEDHGDFSAMVERDPDWFNLCQDLDCKSLYDSYFIDVTSRCNIKCKYCFHDNSGEHRPKEDIIQEARDNRGLAPFILTGGEATTHPDLPEILKEVTSIGEAIVLTNGVKLCDEKYLDEICISGLLIGNVLLVGLSFHKESNGKDIEFLELCRKKGLVLESTLAVIDDVEQIDGVLDVYREYKDVVMNIRIKAASNVWAEQKAEDRIFVSDMLRYIWDLGPTRLDTSKNNKVGFANIEHDGMVIMPVSWYDVFNVDLEDKKGPPWYRAKDGKLDGFLTTCLRNEGLSKQ